MWTCFRYQVQLQFLNTTEGQRQQPKMIPGCNGFMCDLDTFVDIVQSKVNLDPKTACYDVSDRKTGWIPYHEIWSRCEEQRLTNGSESTEVTVTDFREDHTKYTKNDWYLMRSNFVYSVFFDLNWILKIE